MLRRAKKDRNTEIRELHAAEPDRWTPTALAERYGVTSQRISQILRGDRYAHAHTDASVEKYVVGDRPKPVTHS